MRLSIRGWRARSLGWPEAPTATIWCGDSPMTVPADALPRPRLRVSKDPDFGRWRWDVWEGCRWHDGNTAPSWSAALALGLAALEHASIGRM